MQSVVETGTYLADAKSVGLSEKKRAAIVDFDSGADIPVFLLNVFAKNEKTDLTKAERNEFKATLAALAAAYRGKE